MQATTTMEDHATSVEFAYSEIQIQADFCGDNKEAQASVDLVEKEISAIDYELKSGRWTLNQIDYQKAAKSDALLQVDSCIQKLQDAINAP